MNAFFTRQKSKKLKKSKKVVMRKIKKFKNEQNVSEMSYLKYQNDRIIFLKSNLKRCKESNSLLKNIEMKLLIRDEIELLEKETKDFKPNQSSNLCPEDSLDRENPHFSGFTKFLLRLIF